MKHLAASDKWRHRRLYVLVALVLLAKIKVSVAARLLVEDVDLTSKTIWCRNRGRGQPLESVKPKPDRISDDLARILEEWIPHTKCAWLIPGWRRQGFWAVTTGHHRYGRTGRLKAACRAAGCRPITFEQLRRFHAEHAVPYLPFPGIANLSSIVSVATDPAINGPWLPFHEQPATLPVPAVPISGAIAAPPAASENEVSPSSALSPETKGQGPNAAGPLDLIAIANELRRQRLNLEAAFVQHFHNCRQATHAELVEAVCPGEERDWATIKTWVNRVNNALFGLHLAGRLSFRTTMRGYLVIRDTPPGGLSSEVS
jgi:hypothetical protein